MNITIILLFNLAGHCFNKFKTKTSLLRFLLHRVLSQTGCYISSWFLVDYNFKESLNPGKWLSPLELAKERLDSKHLRAWNIFARITCSSYVKTFWLFNICASLEKVKTLWPFLYFFSFRMTFSFSMCINLRDTTIVNFESFVAQCTRCKKNGH